MKKKNRQTLYAKLEPNTRINIQLRNNIKKNKNYIYTIMHTIFFYLDV